LGDNTVKFFMTSRLLKKDIFMRLVDESIRMVSTIKKTAIIFGMGGGAVVSLFHLLSVPLQHTNKHTACVPATRSVQMTFPSHLACRADELLTDFNHCLAFIPSHCSPLSSHGQLCSNETLHATWFYSSKAHRQQCHSKNQIQKSMWFDKCAEKYSRHVPEFLIEGGSM